MKTITLLVAQIFLLTSSGVCQGGWHNEDLKFPLKSITSYCQDSTDLFISTVVINYNNDNRLIKLISFNNMLSDTIITDFDYNAQGLLKAKHSYSFRHTPQSDGMTVYKYDANNRLVYEGCPDEMKGLKNTYSYNDRGQLIANSAEYDVRHWKYSYEYNSQGKLSKKYEDGGFDETTYEYFQNRLIKEIYNQRSGTIETTYDYDGDGLLLYKKENGKVIVRNIYDKGQLVERWTYYFGDDPGFSMCHSQYISKFEYY